tara:strand:- start:121 stop:423 length:303 start_codon:yes stop_codon:yes gene_type:complete
MNQYEMVECVDGFMMSVQASESSYCTPRINNAEKYTEVEVGFPNREEPLLSEWSEDPDNLTGTIYGWVPTQVVTMVIAKHGGMVAGEVPPGVAPLKASSR